MPDDLVAFDNTDDQNGERSGLLMIWVERSSEDAMTAVMNSLCKSGLAENWASELCCSVLVRWELLKVRG